MLLLTELPVPSVLLQAGVAVAPVSWSTTVPVAAVSWEFVIAATNADRVPVVESPRRAALASPTAIANGAKCARFCFIDAFAADT